MAEKTEEMLINSTWIERNYLKYQLSSIKSETLDISKAQTQFQSDIEGFKTQASSIAEQVSVLDTKVGNLSHVQNIHSISSFGLLSVVLILLVLVLVQCKKLRASVQMDSDSRQEALNRQSEEMVTKLQNEFNKLKQDVERLEKSIKEIQESNGNISRILSGLQAARPDQTLRPQTVNPSQQVLMDVNAKLQNHPGSALAPSTDGVCYYDRIEPQNRNLEGCVEKVEDSGAIFFGITTNGTDVELFPNNAGIGWKRDIIKEFFTLQGPVNGDMITNIQKCCVLQYRQAYRDWHVREKGVCTIQ